MKSYNSAPPPLQFWAAYSAKLPACSHWPKLGLAWEEGFSAFFRVSRQFKRYVW